MAPIAQGAHIPVLAFSSDRNVAGNGIYLLSFVAGADVPRMIAYAASKGKTRFAALFPQNEYGRIVEQVFQRAVQENHGQVVMTKTFPPDANGMLPPVKEMSVLAKKDSKTGRRRRRRSTLFSFRRAATRCLRLPRSSPIMRLTLRT